MKRRIPALLLALAAATTIAAQPVQRNDAPQPDISALSDEFTSPASLANWTRFDVAEGWADQVKRAGAENGVLSIEPYTSGWYAEFHAPFFYREVPGAFVVTARVRVRGREGAIPAEPWSLGGLMVREARPSSGKTREMRAENWMFLTTGIAHETGKPVFETKTTVNSRSNLRLQPAREGWVELRVVRVGPSFVFMSRYDGEPWQVRERFYRSDFARSVQVGFCAYTGWNSATDLQNDPITFNRTVLKDRRADLVMDVDWVRFERPTAKVDPMKLTDRAMSDEDIVKIFG